MSLVISSILPFPNISWWSVIAENNQVCFDLAEHFEKMTYRNRYYVSGSNGLIILSIPLVSGRNQRTPVNEVQICNKTRWQMQHWRTLVSVYKRAPYFEFYEPTLLALFEQQFDLLSEFNMTSIQWLQKQLKLSLEITTTDQYKKNYPDVIDLRKMKPLAEKAALSEGLQYYQLFADRNGFLPNLSIIDLLFSEGPYVLQWIKKNKEGIAHWQDAGK